MTETRGAETPQQRSAETTAPTGTAPTGAARRPAAERQTTGWLGWVVFAALMMGLIGLFQAIEGLVAIIDRNYYVVTENGLLVSWNYTAWGWTHLAIGVLLVAAAFGVLSGRVWARIVGIALASLSAVANLVFLAAFPVWSVLLIAVDVLVIYALAVHGAEARD